MRGTAEGTAGGPAARLTYIGRPATTNHKFTGLWGQQKGRGRKTSWVAA